MPRTRVPSGTGAGRARGARDNTLRTCRESLARKAEVAARLDFLVETSKLLNSTLDLAELIGIVLEITTRTTGAGRATLFLVDAERRELWSLVAQGLDRTEIRLPRGRGIAGWVAESGEVVNIPQAYADARFDRSVDERLGFRTRNLLAMPVKDRFGKIVGVLELLNKRSGFTSADIEVVDSISVHAAIALENARLHREALERRALDHQMSLARSIQQSLLPEAAPRLDGLDIGVRHETSYYVGGDYYDFLPLQNGSQLFVVADVEGKGVSSALLMSNLQATLRALVDRVHSIEGVMFTVNDLMRRSTRGEKYLTLFLGLLDPARRGLHYINAGHVPPVVLRARQAPQLLEAGGIVVGLFAGARYRRGFFRLEPGDLILACTDGITEATAGEEQYGTERLVAIAEGTRRLEARQIVDAVFDDLAGFAGDRHQDDRVLLAVKVG